MPLCLIPGNVNPQCVVRLNDPVQKFSALATTTTDLSWEEEFTLCVQPSERGLCPQSPPAHGCQIPKSVCSTVHTQNRNVHKFVFEKVY